MYLSAATLADLTGYAPNQYARMRAWLRQRGWPFEESRCGFPKVAQEYHDLRVMGKAGPIEQHPAQPVGPLGQPAPRFDALAAVGRTTSPHRSRRCATASGA